MPHVPNDFSPAVGPAAPEPSGMPEDEKEDRRRFGMERISLRKYEPDPKTLLTGMFGDTLHVARHTGQLVYVPSTPAPGAPKRDVGQTLSGNPGGAV